MGGVFYGPIDNYYFNNDGSPKNPYSGYEHMWIWYNNKTKSSGKLGIPIKQSENRGLHALVSPGDVVDMGIDIRLYPWASNTARSIPVLWWFKVYNGF